jgi:hypothetical protein
MWMPTNASDFYRIFSSIHLKNDENIDIPDEEEGPFVVEGFVVGTFEDANAFATLSSIWTVLRVLSH